MVEWNVFPLAKVLPIALSFRIGLAEVSKMILYTTLAYIKIWLDTNSTWDVLVVCGFLVINEGLLVVRVR
jgi:hypothetical protein